MQICLSFYEEKNKQATWFSNKIERLYWEQWYINLNVSQLPRTHSSKSHRSKIIVEPGGIIFFFWIKKSTASLQKCCTKFSFLLDLWVENVMEERSARRAALQASLREVLFQIIRFVNEKKDHVPPIPNRDGVESYHYEITLPRWCWCLFPTTLISVSFFCYLFIYY